MAKERNTSIDIAKGIGILLVVFGHAMSPIMNGHIIIEWLYSFIYTFHMPLFFFISGFVATKLVTKPISRFELFKNRVIRLMIPYCIWAIIYLPMKIIMSEHVRFNVEYKWYSFFLGNNPDGQLWFLYVLFIISVFVILFATQKNITVLTIVFMLFSIIAPLIPSNIGFTSISLSFSLYQIGFFFLGMLLSMKADYQKTSHNTPAFIISIVVFIAYGIVLWLTKEKLWFLQALVAVCAIYVCLYLSTLISKSKSSAPLSFLGQKSMEIYILHGPLLVAGRIILPKFISNVYLYIIVISLSTLIISVILSMLINKIKIAKLLLFGAK